MVVSNLVFGFYYRRRLAFQLPIKQQFYFIRRRFSKRCHEHHQLLVFR